MGTDPKNYRDKTWEGKRLGSQRWLGEHQTVMQV